MAERMNRIAHKVNYLKRLNKRTPIKGFDEFKDRISFNLQPLQDLSIIRTDAPSAFLARKRWPFKKFTNSFEKDEAAVGAFYRDSIIRRELKHGSSLIYD